MFENLGCKNFEGKERGKKKKEKKRDSPKF
jgi:hypothetical protein